ncbi:MAG: hypothetical protein WC619_05445 [Patescibacteria group bacterium]
MLDRLRIDTLVDQVVAMARKDKTVPNPEDLREGWETDVLIRSIDASVVGECDDPAVFALIGRRVYMEVRDLPEMAVLAMLMILRGERLLDLDSERQGRIKGLSDDLKTAISALPKGTRKQRCLDLYSYHMGTFYDALGFFKLAVKMYKWAARQAGSRSSSAAISRYCAARSCLKQALLVGEPPDKLEALFSDLEKKFGRLAKALHGSELYAQWAEGNCPMHMILACIWLDRSYPRWEEWTELALAAPEKLGKAWEPGAEFVRVVNMNKGAKEALVAVAENRAANNEIRATALLILARRSASPDEAGGFMEIMPEGGTQYVQAIAKRMMTT